MSTAEPHHDRLADFTTDARVLLLSGMAVIIGAISALVAYGLIWLIGTMSNLAFFQEFSSVMKSPAGNRLGFLVICVPVIGGLVVGFMARYGSEKIRGHGIPEALEAILIGRSRIEAKVALLKPVSSAIAIGTGGPFGAEGPIIMTGGAFGSLFAQLFHLSPAERKTLLVAGASAGMAAVFATPIAAVLLAVELLLFEWKPRSFIPVAIASVVASTIRIPLLGEGPIFAIPAHQGIAASGLLVAALIGVIAGLASSALTNMVYGFEDLFQKLPVHWMWWPVIGGIVVGIGGMIDPRILGVGYEFIDALLKGNLVGPTLVGLLLLKALVWAFALGSGTSGGVLAPLLMMGGALGGLLAYGMHLPDPGLWATIGMAAMMGGTMRSPFTAIVFTLELTGGIRLLPALLVACMASEIITVLLLRRSILTEKVARRGHHIVREYSVDPFQLIRVHEVMDRIIPTVTEDMKLGDLADKIAGRDPALTRHHAVAIVDAEQRLKGIITRGDILRALDSDGSKLLSVLEAGTKNPLTTYPDVLLHEAVDLILKRDVGRLLVVDRRDPTRVVGYLGRPGILRARLRRHEEEHVREPGWLGRFTVGESTGEELKP